MDKEEIEKRLKKLEEENQQIKKQNQKLKQIIQNKVGRSQNISNSSADSKVSRRDFLKKLGAGAISLGALATPVASKMTISSNGIYKDGNEAFLGLSGSKTVSSNLDMNSNNIQNVNSISTGKADITNETFILGYLSSDISSISSGSFTNFIDTEVEDVRNEFNSSQQFVPDKTGYYDIVAQADVDVGADTDSVIYRLRNVTDSTTLVDQSYGAGGNGFPRSIFSATTKLTSGKKYELQVTDNNNSYGILSGKSLTRLTIKRSIVGP